MSNPENDIEATTGLNRNASEPSRPDVRRQADTLPGFAGNPAGTSNAGPTKREFKGEQNPDEENENLQGLQECGQVLGLIIAKQVVRAYFIARNNINYVIDYGESIPGTIESQAEEQYKNLGSSIFSGSYSWSTFFCQLRNTFLPSGQSDPWTMMKGMIGVLFAFQPELKPKIVNDLNDELSERIEHLKSEVDKFVNDYTGMIEGIDSGPELSPENDPTGGLTPDDIRIEQNSDNIPDEEFNKGILDKISEVINTLEGFDPEEEDERIGDIGEQIDIIGRCLEFSQERKDQEQNFPNELSDGTLDNIDEIAENYEQIDEDLARRINNRNISADELKQSLEGLRSELENMGRDRSITCITVIVPTGKISQAELQATLFEDTDEDGNAENSKEVVIREGANCFNTDGLDVSDGNDYWINWEDQNNNYSEPGQKTEKDTPNMQYGGENLFGDNQKMKFLKNLRDQIKRLIVLMSSLQSDINDIVNNLPSLTDPLSNMQFFDGMSLKLSDQLEKISVQLQSEGTAKKDEAIEQLKNTEIMVAAFGNLNKNLDEFSNKFKEGAAEEWESEVESLQDSMQEGAKEFLNPETSGRWRSSFDKIIFKLNTIHSILDSIVKGQKFRHTGYQAERLDKLIINLQKDLESVFQMLEGLSMLQKMSQFNQDYSLDNMLKDNQQNLKKQAEATKKQISTMMESLNGNDTGVLGKGGLGAMFGQSANFASCIEVVKNSTKFVTENLVDPSVETMAKVSSFLEDTNKMIESWIPDFPPESWRKGCGNNESIIGQLQELRKEVKQEAQDVFKIFKLPEPPKSPAQRRLNEPEEIEVSEENEDELPNSPGSNFA